MTTPQPRLSTEVANAYRDGRAIVVLESTIFSPLGLPEPHNHDALRRCTEVIRAGGAVPAVAAVLDGEWRVGLEPDEQDRVLARGVKVAERDLGVAMAQRWPVGVTTVSATVALAHHAGISVFSTGGIGGVHRGAEFTGDVSSDLDALANHPVVTVCAGAKGFLDLPRTLEYLETSGVPVLGWRHNDFPAFYTRSSGVAVPHRVETAAEVAHILRYRPRRRLGALLTVPIPEPDQLDPASIDGSVSAVLQSCEAAGVTGTAVTPYVLAALESETEGASIGANLSLAENNAAVATEVASALAG